MREIVLDTETTGLSAKTGDRVVEIGCVELQNYVVTGQVYHSYVNPEREMPKEAQAVHGLSEEFLAEKPLFGDIASEFLAFIASSPLVIHNAAFDMEFINRELTSVGLKPLAMSRAIDTVSLSRNKFPGAPANLNALCRRFGIDNSDRTKHGALLDAELLAEVYLELRGGRQPALSLSNCEVTTETQSPLFRTTPRQARSHTPTAEELLAHRKLLNDIDNPIWKK